MRTVLCYGDSNTWGFDPVRQHRYPREVRWPGRLQAALGADWHVVEEGLNGRTTTLDSPPPCLPTSTRRDAVGRGLVGRARQVSAARRALRDGRQRFGRRPD